MTGKQSLGVPIDESSIQHHKLTLTEKQKDNWKWLRSEIDHYARSTTSNSPEELEKYLINYRLYNGRGVYKTEVNSPFVSKELEDEGYYMTSEDIPHFDIITPIVKSELGQQQSLPFKPIATDGSVDNVNSRKKKRLELYRQHINETIVAPIKQEAIQQWMLENNISDPGQLDPEMQKQMQQQVDQKTKAMLPKDIERYMSTEYRSPRETLLQRVTELTVRRDKMKFWTDENFKHMLITGKQVYETGIDRGKAFFRICNPVNYVSGGDPNNFFEEDADWQIYTENITLSTLFRDHGHEISSTDLNKLKEYNSQSAVARSRGEIDGRTSTILAQIDAETGLFDRMPHQGTHEGQMAVANLMARFGNINPQDAIFERITVVFKSLRKFKLVTRYNQEENKYEDFWVDGEYTKNPHKDFKVQTVWFPHAYIGKRVSYGNVDHYMYFDMGPVPNQYKNVLRPWDITMPFMGAKYSSLFGNTENVAPMDLAKPWQDKFNIKLAMLQEKEATDIGKIFSVASTLKPEGWSFGKWMMMARYGKLLPLETTGELINGIDAQMFKGYDLGQLQDLALHLQHLDWIRNQAALAMSYNPQRLGQIVNTEAVRNAQANVQQSTYQTQDLYTLHNEVVERLLNRHVNNEIMALKDSEMVASYVLDDMSIAELTINKEILDSAEIGITIRNSAEDYNNLRDIKTLGQAMIQNQMITFPELIRLQIANNMSDALSIAERSEEKMIERQQQAQEQQAQQAQQIEAMKAEMQKLQMEFEAGEKAKDRASAEFREEVRATLMSNQMDIDKDGQSDLIAIKEIDSREKEKDREHESVLKDKELENKIQTAKISASKKPST